MADMTASAHFSIKYDGPALDRHQMDVRELAPALIALSDLLEQANKAALPDAPAVRVNVRGFKSGSFGIDLLAEQSITQQLVSLLSGPHATAAANLIALLSALGFMGAGVTKGLIPLIKWLKGRKPSTIRFDGDKTVFEISHAETVEKFETDLITGRLYQTRVVRQSLAKVIKPLEREGIDSFSVIDDEKAYILVTKSELSYFEAAALEADVVSDTIAEKVLLQIESAVFKDDNKWRFSDGGSPFYAEISDAEFLQRVNAGIERFGKRDVLIADVRRVQTITDNGLKIEQTVVKVHEHKEPLQQDLLPKN